MGDEPVLDGQGRVLGSPACVVKRGCSDPVARCVVPAHGWTDGIGGCPNAGGICIGCTTPDFPDPLTRSGRPARRSRSTARVRTGRAVRALRNFASGAAVDR